MKHLGAKSYPIIVKCGGQIARILCPTADRLFSQQQHLSFLKKRRPVFLK